MEDPCVVMGRRGIATVTVTAQGPREPLRHEARGPGLLTGHHRGPDMATRGDRYLATSGDFFMATDKSGTIKAAGNYAVGNNGEYFAVSRRCRPCVQTWLRAAMTLTAAWSVLGIKPNTM